MGDIPEPCIPVDGFHQRLSEYHLYEGRISEMNPISDIIPYDLNTPLFSDYARKLRMIYVPKKSSVAYREEGLPDYPVGTVLVKNFYYDLDERDPTAGRRIVETRLLIHREKGWQAAPYIWNEEQEEAFLRQTGGRKYILWKDRKGNIRKVDYLIPAKNDCKTCHSRNNTLLPLGPTMANLNKTYPYADGAVNQLERWEQADILRDRPDVRAIPRAPVWDDSSTWTLNERARIYLDVNCGHCHNPAGSANNSGLFLTYGQEDSFRLGICKPPVAAGNGSGGLQFDIFPCRPDLSIMLYRMNSAKPAERMPELGRMLVHEEGVALIREWIESLDCASCEDAQQ